MNKKYLGFRFDRCDCEVEFLRTGFPINAITPQHVSMSASGEFKNQVNISDSFWCPLGTVRLFLLRRKRLKVHVDRDDICFPELFFHFEVLLFIHLMFCVFHKVSEGAFSNIPGIRKKTLSDGFKSASQWGGQNQSSETGFCQDL